MNVSNKVFLSTKGDDLFPHLQKLQCMIFDLETFKNKIRKRCLFWTFCRLKELNWKAKDVHNIFFDLNRELESFLINNRSLWTNTVWYGGSNVKVNLQSLITMLLNFNKACKAKWLIFGTFKTTQYIHLKFFYVNSGYKMENYDYRSSLT